MQQEFCIQQKWRENGRQDAVSCHGQISHHYGTVLYIIYYNIILVYIILHALFKFFDTFAQRFNFFLLYFVIMAEFRWNILYESISPCKSDKEFLSFPHWKTNKSINLTTFRYRYETCTTNLSYSIFPFAKFWTKFSIFSHLFKHTRIASCWCVRRYHRGISKAWRWANIYVNPDATNVNGNASAINLTVRPLIFI